MRKEGKLEQNLNDKETIYVDLHSMKKRKLKMLVEYCLYSLQKVAQSLFDYVSPCKTYGAEVSRKGRVGGCLQTCKHEVRHVTFCSISFSDFFLFFFFFLLLLILSCVFSFSLAHLST